MRAIDKVESISFREQFTECGCAIVSYLDVSIASLQTRNSNVVRYMPSKMGIYLSVT